MTDNVAPTLPPAHRFWLFAVAAVAFSWFAWEWWWVCDDAYISFRYSKHLADGIGLRYNPADPPIEGYSNFLWVVYLAGARLLGGEIPVVAMWTSAVTGLALMWVLAVSLGRATAGRWVPALLAVLFLVTLPPVAVWTTSGLATMPSVCAIFAVWTFLLNGSQPRWRLAALASAAGVLLRADGFVFLGLVHAGAFFAGQLGRDQALRNAAFKSGLVTVATFGAQTLFRILYHGDWVPNTARVKGGLSAMTLERGLYYDTEFLLSFVAVPLAIVVPALLWGPAPRRQRLTAWSMVLGGLAYCIYVGGDWMSMGRMLVLSLPFLACLLASSLAQLMRHGWLGGLGALAIAAACITTSLNAGAGDYLVPKSVRSEFHFRWNTDKYIDPHEHYQVNVGNTSYWTSLGRVLKRATRPGDSLVIGTIGAIGYYSDLHIYDTFGLVNRMGRELDIPRKRRSPGHDQHIPVKHFLQYDPTYLGAKLVPRSQPDYMLPPQLRPNYEFADQIEIRLHPLNNDRRLLRLGVWKPK